MIETMLENTKMILTFMIPFVLVRVADICFGIILSVKDNVLPNFDFHKLLKGICWSIVSAIGVVSLGCGAVILPEILYVFPIPNVEIEALTSLVNMASLTGIMITTIVTYGKDAYTKMLQVFELKEIPAPTYPKEIRINEDGEEDGRYS